MSILITIIAIILIIAGLIYGTLTLMVLVGFRNDYPIPIADWDSPDYFAMIAPLIPVALGVFLIWYF